MIKLGLWHVRIRSSLARRNIVHCDQSESVLPHFSAVETPPLLLVGLYVPE